MLDLIRNSEGTKLLILIVIFCLVFTAPAKWRVELQAKPESLARLELYWSILV